jgi:CheY-like chemotaxis protein
MFRIYIPAFFYSSLTISGKLTEKHKESGKILLMDDEEGVRMVTAKMLEYIGYKTVPVLNGEEAIESYMAAIADDEPFDIVIMDLTVPKGLGGKETVMLLKEIDPYVNAVVSSGYADDPAMVNYEDYGFAAAVLKPYKINELSEVLKKIHLA